MLTPEEIHSKEFTEHRLGGGYDINEVDDFLDYVAAELQKQKNAAAAAPVAVVPPVPVDPPTVVAGPSVESIALLLDNAQKAADQLHADAQQQAAVTSATAAQQAQKLIDDARVQAAQIIAEAQTQAAQTVAQAELQRQELADKVTSLRAQHRDIAGKLKDALTRLAFTDEEAS